MNQPRNCRHNADPTHCFRCKWCHIYPELDRPFDRASMRPPSWGAPRSLPSIAEPRTESSRPTSGVSTHGRNHPRSPNNPQFDDEHPTDTLSPNPSESRPLAFRRSHTHPVTSRVLRGSGTPTPWDHSEPFSQSILSALSGNHAPSINPRGFGDSPTPWDRNEDLVPSFSSPPSYTAATALIPTEDRIQRLRAEARSLAERSASLMARSQEFCDLAQVTPQPTAFAYPSSEILRRSHETRLEFREALMARWRDHGYDVAVWQEALERWSANVEELRRADRYDHSLAVWVRDLRRDEKELEALARQSGLPPQG